MREQPGSILCEHSGYAATIAATAIAVPPHILTSDDVKTYIRKVFDLEERRLDAMMAVIDNAQVSSATRSFPSSTLSNRDRWNRPVSNIGSTP